MTDLDSFAAWARKTGAYQTVEAIARYRRYLDHMKAMEAEAMMERGTKDE